jgi:peptidoglycan hydrolase-like protein with peptidoglycan-binding domain
MSFEQWLQSRLTAHGYPCGAIDGVIGAATTAAIKGFQNAKGLAVTGTATAETIDALRTSSSAVAGAPSRGARPGSPWPKQSGVSAFYGGVGTSQTQIEIPFDMVLAWDKSTRIRKMTLHKKVAPSAERVLNRVAGIYSAQDRINLGLNLFGGSLNVRKMRGGSSYSMHSWGIAIDFDPERNQLKWGANKARLAHSDAVPFWLEWENEGWLSLGRARNYDFMHVQAARL